MGNCFGLPHGARAQAGDPAYERMLTNDPSVDPPPPYEAAPSVGQHVQQRLLMMNDEERFQFVRRMTLLQLLPVGTYKMNKGEKRRECIICMTDIAVGDAIRLLPCMHLYHQECIDDWLSRSFSCPTCMKDLDAALDEMCATQRPPQPPGMPQPPSASASSGQAPMAQATR